MALLVDFYGLLGLGYFKTKNLRGRATNGGTFFGGFPNTQKELLLQLHTGGGGQEGRHQIQPLTYRAVLRAGTWCPAA